MARPAASFFPTVLLAVSLIVGVGLPIPAGAAVTVEYDRFKDVTIYRAEKVMLDRGRLRGWMFEPGKETLEFQAAASVPGTERIVPDYVWFYFLSSSTDWRFLQNRELIFIIGEERVRVGGVERRGDVSPGYVSEQISVAVPYRLMRRIVAAGKVEGRVGNWEFAFDPATIRVLSQFTDRIEGVQDLDHLKLKREWKPE